MAISPESVRQAEFGAMSAAVASRLDPLGFDSHPFLIGWYNERVGPKFRLPYTDDTPAVVVLSRPDMFEKTFVPFLVRGAVNGEAQSNSRDPLDECMSCTMATVREELFPELRNVAVMHDFELLPNRRPKILAQTAAHVSGAVRLFQESDVAPELLANIGSAKVYPVCLHPRFGGWFAIRCVFVFEDVLSPQLPRPPPCPLNLSDEKIAELLRLYNDSWRDYSFRDIGVEAEAKYSQLQREYFDTKPEQRWKLVEESFGIN